MAELLKFLSSFENCFFKLCLKLLRLLVRFSFLKLCLKLLRLLVRLSASGVLFEKVETIYDKAS